MNEPTEYSTRTYLLINTAFVIVWQKHVHSVWSDCNPSTGTMIKGSLILESWDRFDASLVVCILDTKKLLCV